MAVSEDYIQFILDQLRCVGTVVAKKMFGGAGLYLDKVFFALIADDVLYFKADDSNRRDYEKAGMGPFRPFDEKSYTMQYYEVPVDVIEDVEELGVWANKAVVVAKQKLSVKIRKKQPD